MALKLVEEKLAQEQLVYEALRRGDTATVCYRAERDSQWGVRDGNYTNRLRLGYYLWHFGIADEAVVAYLFEEELKDRKSHSFQGIGDSLRILTKLLRQYNDDGTFEIIAAYNDVIQYYLRLANLSEACRCCRLVMDTTDYGQIVHIRLFGDILEACFELTAQAPAKANDLWLWAKQALTNDFTMRYGNLYTKALAAAQAIKNPFAATLTQQYQAWLAQNHYPKER